MNNPVFEFEKRRDFGSVIGDSLFFLTRNFKSFTLGFLMYVGPFFLIGALAMVYASTQFTNFMRSAESAYESILAVVVFIPFIIAASIMVFAFVCAMVQKSQRSLSEPLIENIWPDVRKNILPVTVAFLTILFLVFVPFALLLGIALILSGPVATIALMLLLFPVIIYFAVVFTIFLIVHVIERSSVGISLKRAFHLVRDKWWNTFGVYIVISLLASIASYIFMIPAYIIFFVQTLSSIDSGELSPQFGMWMGIMYACGFLGSLFASMYQTLGMILQYYSLREQKDGVGLLRRIQEIDKPAGSVEF